MEINKITKTKYGYNIYTENDKINIETKIFNKYKLKKGDKLSLKLYNEIMALNKVEFIKRKSLLYLTRRRSTKEFITYLYKLEAQKSLIKSLVEEYTNKGYLDDYLYAELLIDKEKQRYGKNRIKQILFEKGIKSEIVDSLLEDFVDINLENQIKKASITIKANNYNDAKLKLTRSFVRKGYNLNDINEYIYKHLNKERFNEDKSIKKHYLNALKRYKKNYEGYELNLKIKQYLYSRGFNMKTINKIIAEGVNN